MRKTFLLLGLVLLSDGVGASSPPVLLDDELVKFSLSFPTVPSPLLNGGSSLVYVNLDGRWYQTSPVGGGVPDIMYSGPHLVMPSASMTFCVRSNGQAQQFGGFTVYASASYFPIYQVQKVKYKPLAGLPGNFVLEIKTAFGDMRCQGEVVDPRPDRIFANGFDVADRLFSNGFQQ